MSWKSDPNQVFARHDYRNSNQSIPNSADTTIVFDNTVLEVGLSMSRTSGVYTVNKAGFWQVSCVVDWASDPSGGRLIRIERNGNAIAQHRVALANGIVRMPLTGPVVEMAALDTFEIVVNQDSGGALNVNGGQASTWVSFEWIGPA